MTKAEVIRKLAKKVGVQDLDAKIFFEVFLRKVSLQLNPGETIKIKNFGFFQMHTGKIKKTHFNNSNPISADLIAFYPLLEEQNEAHENLIFNIPNKKEEEYNLIDSYFSLSFGKPVIPLKGANISEYFIPLTGNELRRLFDTKAEKLMQEMEVVENYVNENEILLNNSDLLNSNQMEINWDEINNNPVSPEKFIGDREQGSLKEPDVFSWEFGEALEKQIEEAALLDIGNEDNLFVEYDDLKDISWDFGENINGTEELSPLTEDKKETNEKETDNDKLEKEPDEFQRVKSVLSELKIDHNDSDLSDHISAEDSELLKSINEELNEEGFAEVKHNPRKYKFKNDLYEKYDEDNGTPEIEDEKHESEVDENINPSILYTGDQMHDIDETDKEIFQTPDLIPDRPERSLGYSKRKGIGLYVIFASLLVIGGTILLYFKIAHMNYPDNKKPVNTKISGNNPPAVIIKRDFEIPVTYPYINDSSVAPAIDPIDKNVFNQFENKIKDDSIGPNLKVQHKEIAPVKQLTQTYLNNNVQSSAVRVKDFIYKSGDKYLVQISSWSSEQKAIKHASYFKNKGFQTEIEEASLPIGTWYRVRVGNFNSENEAEKFYNKYK
jgi:nucleoid DNA-binding protein